MLKDERHTFILQKLQQDNVVHVNKLALDLAVNAVTIRRDLAQLEAAGKLHRVHGGAICQENSLPINNLISNQAGRIAKAAASFIPDPSVIFLGPGTLTQAMVPFLNQHQQLTVITNALNVAWNIAQHKKHTLHLIGGQVGPDYGLYGDPDALRRIRVDWVVLEAGGLDAARGLTHDHRDYANMARGLFALNAQVITLLPQKNLNRANAMLIVPANEIDVLITGREAHNSQLWDLSELGVRIVLA